MTDVSYYTSDAAHRQFRWLLHLKRTLEKTQKPELVLRMVSPPMSDEQGTARDL